MNASTKTRSALRAALEHEDASISQRLRKETQAAVAQLQENVPQTTPAASEPDAKPKAANAAQAAPAAGAGAAPAKVVKAKPVARTAAAARPAAKPGTAKSAAKAKAAAAAPATVEPSSPAKGKVAKKGGDVAAKAIRTATATKTAAKPAVAEAGDGKKEKREKVVRDSFSMPASEHRRIKALREQLGKAGRLSSKSEVLRAGLHLLGQRSGAELVALLDGLAPVTKGKHGKKH